MLIIRLVMVHMGPKHTQYGQKTARLAPVLQNGLNVHVGALTITGVSRHHTLKRRYLHLYTVAPLEPSRVDKHDNQY